MAPKLVINGWAFPDSPPKCPQGADVTSRRIQVIKALSAARKLIGLGCRPAYYAICVAESSLRNKVREDRASVPSSQSLLQSELQQLEISCDAERVGSGSSTATPWTCGLQSSTP